MYTPPSECPRCGSPLAISKYECQECGTSIQGHFGGASGPLARLTPEQVNFVITFVRCEGKINRMESELGISYPTIRNRMMEIIQVLDGGAPRKRVRFQGMGARRQVLENLEQGLISLEDALDSIRGEE